MGHHTDAIDGRLAAEQLRERMRKEKVAVVAFENLAATVEENQEALRQLQQKRTEFLSWRMRTKPTDDAARTVAEGLIDSVMGHPVYGPMMAEAFLHGIPIRFIESVSPQQAKKIRNLNAQNDREFEAAANAPTIMEGILHMQKANQLLDQMTDERNPDMIEEIEKLQKEFSGKGTVVSWAGQGHSDVIQQTESERINAYRERNLQLDPEIERTLPSFVRAGQTLVLTYLDGLLRARPRDRGQIMLAATRAKKLTEEDLRQLDQIVGSKKGNERYLLITNTLIKWTREGK